MGSCGPTLQQTDSDPDPNAGLSDGAVREVLAVATAVHYMGGGSKRASVMLRSFGARPGGEGMKDKVHKDAWREGNWGSHRRVLEFFSTLHKTHFNFLQHFSFTPVQQPSTPRRRTYI